MPNADIKTPAYVPTEEVIRTLEKFHAYLQRPEIRFRKILDAARFLCERTGAQYPPGIYHKKER